MQTSAIPRSAPERDQKRSLRRSRYGELELSERQAARINAALADGRAPGPYLSPRQRSRVVLGDDPS